MKVFSTLYKRGKGGEILYWKIQAIGYDKHDDSPAEIQKESGQLGTTNPIRHVEVIREGKNLGRANATTPYEQACLQAESDWKKKKDSGYKALNDLDIEEQTSEPNNGMVRFGGLLVGPLIADLATVLDAALPAFNTDASGNVKPMLATDWKKIKKINYPVIVQPKLDGVRCLMIINEHGVKFLSRSGKEYTTLDHIAADVLRWDFYKSLAQTVILDGEVYSDELSFQGIMRAVKKQRPESLKLHFRCYDIVNDEKQLTRVDQYQKLVAAINSPYIQAVITHVANEDQIKPLHDNFVKAGNEGLMIRLFNGKYEQGCRSRSLLKVKEFDENEFTFLRWEQGQREEDLLAVLTKSEGGALFKAKMIGTREEKDELRKSHPKLITVKHFGWTEGDDPLPRFPIGKGPRDGE